MLKVVLVESPATTKMCRFFPPSGLQFGFAAFNANPVSAGSVPYPEPFGPVAIHREASRCATRSWQGAFPLSVFRGNGCAKPGSRLAGRFVLDSIQLCVNDVDLGGEPLPCAGLLPPGGL